MNNCSTLIKNDWKPFDMRMSSYVLPESVQKVVCKRAGVEHPRRIVLLDAHSNCLWRGKPKYIRECVCVYVPWLRRNSELSRMIYNHEMEYMQELREVMVRLGCEMRYAALTTDTFRRLRDVQEMLVRTFNHRHAYFHTLLDQAIELQTMSILLNVRGPDIPF